MHSQESYLALHQLTLVQRRAGVAPEIADLVTAYGRLRIDAGLPLVFDYAPFDAGSAEARFLARLEREHPGSDVRFLRFLAAYHAELERRRLPAILSVAELVGWLGLTARHLRYLCADTRRHYRELSIPKRSGGVRTLHAPTSRLASAQRLVLRKILDRATPHAAAHGFRRRRSIASNARQHAGREVVVRFDLKDFFPSVRFRSVRRAFQALGYPYSIAALLTRLCTRDGGLPQGACTSPALANLACRRLDARLDGLARGIGASYTRYADDLVFSADEWRHRSSELVETIVRDEGFELRAEKTRIQRRSSRQSVTGLVVNERPGLPREHVRLLRAALHRLSVGGRADVSRLAAPGSSGSAWDVLNGHLGLLGMVDPARAASLRERLRSCDLG